MILEDSTTRECSMRDNSIKDSNMRDKLKVSKLTEDHSTTEHLRTQSNVQDKSKRDLFTTTTLPLAEADTTESLSRSSEAAKLN